MTDLIDIDTLRESFRDLLGDQCSAERVLKHFDGNDISFELWPGIAELGWIGLGVPEAAGGLGLGMSASAALYIELGRAVAPIPLLSAALVAEAIAFAGDAKQHAVWLPMLLSGEKRATLTLPWPYHESAVKVARQSGGVILSGGADYLIDGKNADLALICAMDEHNQPVRIILDAGIDGFEIQTIETTDATRSFGRIRFDQLELPADRVLAGTEAGAAIEARLARHGALAMACDAIGGSEAVLEATIDYLKMREQFGRPIGSFQALKHRCADHKMTVVAAATLLDEAIRLVDSVEDADRYIHAAKAYCCEVYADVSRDAVQLHGGIGFTWEYRCHLYLKRAKLNEALFGSGADHLDLLFNVLAA